MSLQGTYSVPQIMIDLETLSPRYNAALLSIGACSFGEGKTYSEFYRVIDAKSCVAMGMHVDPDTMEWWKGQSSEAKAVFKALSIPLKQALLEFSEWMPGGGNKNMRLWANGLAHDIPILTNAFETCGMKLPGHWANQLDARTIYKLCPEVKWDRVTAAHNALDDAKAQALHLMKCLDI